MSEHREHRGERSNTGSHSFRMNEYRIAVNLDNLLLTWNVEVACASLWICISLQFFIRSKSTLY